MTYSIKYSKTSEKQIRKLDKIMQKRIISSLDRCKIRPYSHVEKLVGVSYYRLRVGDYRVIMNVKDNILEILVVEIGNRKNIYRK